MSNRFIKYAQKVRINEPEAFNMSSNLINLDLSNRFIEEINSKTFSNIQNLILTKNVIKRINKFAFYGLNLISLDLRDQNLTKNQ